MELEAVVEQLRALSQQEIYGSVLVLGDLLVSSAKMLGLQARPALHLSVLTCYARSLQEDMQYRRALQYYEEALKILQLITSPTAAATQKSQELPSECDVMWQMYKCHMQLKEPQAALDILLAVPLKEQRCPKVTLAMARIYKDINKDTKSAIICYKQALSLSPLAVEAMLGLISLGMTLHEVTFLSAVKAASQTSPLHSLPWLNVWIEAQACIAKEDFSGGVSGFERFSKMGLVLSPDTSCQLAWCMQKLDRKAQALEIFSAAHLQDTCTLKHMDTYSRILTSKTKLQRLSDSLLYASTVHSEPWMATAWCHMRNRDVNLRSSNPYHSKHTFVEKAYSICPRNSEAVFFQGSLLIAKTEPRNAIQKYQEALLLDPSFFDAYEAIIRCYLMVRSDKEALTFARAASRHIKQPAQLHYLEGLALSQKVATSTKAMLAFERAIRADKTFEKAIIALSSLYIHDNDTERAAQFLAKHLEVVTSPLLHTELANCFMRLKKYHEAMDQFSLALCQDPFYEKALRGIEHVQSLNSSELEDASGSFELAQEDDNGRQR